MTLETEFQSQANQFSIESIGIQSAISVRVAQSHAMGIWTVHMMLQGLIQPTETISYPADWWQGVKLRWLPKWLKRRYPIKMTLHRFQRFCPHLGDGEPDSHVRYLKLPNGEAPLDLRMEI